MGKGRRVSGLLLPVILLALLVVLAWLQFRWTGQISRAERERLEARVQSAARRFARDMDDEAAAVFRLFRIEPAFDIDALGPVLRERWERYRDEARYPELVEELYFVDTAGGLSRLDSSDRMSSVEWPDNFAALREQMNRRGRAERRGRPVPFPVLSGMPAAVAIPVGGRQQRWPRFAMAGYVLVTLRSGTLQDSIFPELAERHFGDEYDVSVIYAGDEVIFTTATQTDPVVGEPDAREELFSLGRFLGRRPRGDERRGLPPETQEARRQLGEGFEVLVRHRSGSLEAAVASARLRNLAVSFGILGLLAASIVLVVVSTRRATELNDRKMEFVAGVSHELRTPVAVLRSVGQNLADGSVSEPEQVKRYGTLIETEGRRLSELLEQVLERAGIESNKRRYRHENLLVRSLVESALADAEAARKEKNVSIETAFPPDDLELVGDADALRRALSNIVLNAIKHGGDKNEIDVTVEQRGDMVATIVSDHGPGIPDEERGLLFEAFYRGREARERHTPGSGLGLSLVDYVAREHGGSVTVESTPGEGSRFTFMIPVRGQHANG